MCLHAGICLAQAAAGLFGPVTGAAAESGGSARLTQLSLKESRTQGHLSCRAIGMTTGRVKRYFPGWGKAGRGGVLLIPPLNFNKQVQGPRISYWYRPSELHVCGFPFEDSRRKFMEPAKLDWKPDRKSGLAQAQRLTDSWHSTALVARSRGTPAVSNLPVLFGSFRPLAPFLQKSPLVRKVGRDAWRKTHPKFPKKIVILSGAPHRFIA
jgi:hypothetical protein